jgi:hypothetical protein
LCMLIMPMIISVFFEKCRGKRILVLQMITLAFFVVESLLAVYERITLTSVFYKAGIDEYRPMEDWEFRSHALLGHPLANAMVIAVIMAFIVTNHRLTPKLKISAALLGYIALFCFNARGATIVVSALIMPYLFLQMYNRYKAKRVLIIIFTTIVVASLLYIVFETGLGGRLTNSDKLIDGSAQTRLEVYSFYKFVDVPDLLLGNSKNYLFVMNKLHAGGVENGVVVLILNYGIIFTIPILLLLFSFQFNKLKIYNKIDRWLILAVFYLIGFMNPNLASPIQWTIFVFAYYSFRNIPVSRKLHVVYNYKHSSGRVTHRT